MGRREFLRLGLGLAAQAAWVPAGLRAAPAPVAREGLYTNQFTCRSGLEPLALCASLLDARSVEVTIRHLDGPTLDAVVGRWQVAVDGTQRVPPSTPGGLALMGPDFPVRLSLDTSRWEPGLYEASIDPLAMRAENRVNTSGQGWPSENHVCRFVVTSGEPGRDSNILWLHDGLTGTAYGGFGNGSIYPGEEAAQLWAVSHRRPGLERGTNGNKWLLRWLKARGHRFEYMDIVSFSEQAPDFLEAYDLIVACGQFEYLPHAFFANLVAHVARGGNLLLAANELGAFRTRMHPSMGIMETYKWYAEVLDPIDGGQRAGTGMHVPASILETELAGLTVWGACDYGYEDKVDLRTTNKQDAGWLFEGTGMVDTVPSAYRFFAAGNRGRALSGDRFEILDHAISRTSSDTVAWAVAPSTDARMWWLAKGGQPRWQWPLDPRGHAMCTWREAPNGARVIGLPSQSLLQAEFYRPDVGRLIENLFAYLTESGAAVPTVGPVGLGLTAAALAETGRRALAGPPKRSSNS